MDILEQQLKVGTKIKLGPEYCKYKSFKPGSIVELVQGYFEYDNGLYTETQTAPSLWNDGEHEFESIYYLFGNDLDEFMDCEVIS